MGWWKIRMKRLIFACTSVALLAAPCVAAPPADAQRSGAEGVVVEPPTERLINATLKYLASKQLPNGSFEDRGHQAAITAYAMLAFMTCGNLPDEGPYGAQMSRGLKFLLDCVRPDGYIAAAGGESNMYGHGIATIVLGELYGQTRDEQIRPKLERAIACIVASQNKEGGWRYNPRPADADMSVTVLQVIALRVAVNAGLDVPKETLDRAVQYVRSCQHQPSGGFTYMPRRSDPGFARTSAAVYSLQVLGLYDDPMVTRGAEYMQQHKDDTREWFTYGHFYAAPVMYMIGGEAWSAWYREMTQLLVPKAKWAGDIAYWDHIGGRGDGGPVYATAVYTMILAMPYNYLPLYQR